MFWQAFSGTMTRPENPHQRREARLQGKILDTFADSQAESDCLQLELIELFGMNRGAESN